MKILFNFLGMILNVFLGQFLDRMTGPDKVVDDVKPQLTTMVIAGVDDLDSRYAGVL